ncbi:enterochelin esterase domain-containing protein [Microbacterium gilvum]|uniref:Esterase family protein n=1 Tax=Microbacterium gilvum TaxID=1336204 RepID=A0ABP9A104_9MICO
MSRWPRAPRTPFRADGSPIRVEPEALLADARTPGFWDRHTTAPVLGGLVDGFRETSFLWRPTRRGTEAMVHINSVTDRHREDITAARFARIGGTDVHHVSVLLPDELVASYRIVEAGHLPVDAGRDRPGWLRIHEAGVPDPLGSETLPNPLGRRSSVLRMPASRQHPAWRAARRDAGGARQPVRLDTRHPLWAIDPDDEPAHLLVLFDGETWRGLPLAAALAQRDGPPLAVLLVDSGPQRADLLPHPERIASLVEEVVVPAARRRWPRARDTVVAGQSYGGLAAASLAVLRPDLVSAAVAQSGSFQFRAGEERRRDATEPGDLIRRLGALRVTARVHVQAGAEEHDLSAQAEMFADAAERAGAVVTGEQRAGGHDYAWWSDALFDGLDVVLGRSLSRIEP